MTSYFTKNKSVFTLTLLFVVLFAPQLVIALDTTPPPTTDTGITWVCKEGTLEEGNCTFEDVIKAIQKLITWARNFALFFSVIVLVYAGFLYMTSGGNASKRSEANKMLYKVVLGIVIVMAAWLIVTLITDALLGDSVDTFLG